jgi:hypothetical protein
MDPARAGEIIAPHLSLEGALLPILHALRETRRASRMTNPERELPARSFP